MNSRMSNKYVAETFFVIVFSFIGLAAAFYSMADNYTKSHLMLQLEGYATSVETDSLRHPEDAALREREQYGIDLIGQTTGHTVLVADSTGLVRLSSDPDLLGPLLSQAELNQIAGEANYIGALPDLFPTASQVVAHSRLDASGDLASVTIVVASADANTVLLSNLMRMFSLSSYGVLAMTLVVIYFSTNRMTRPLKSMSYAARRFGQGNFDVRVEVRGDDEMAELAMAFNNMADSLEKNEEMRRTFIANVSHDLKTPMTTIAGFVDGILDGTIPPELERHYLNLVSDEVLRLSRLVNTLLDLAKFETDEVKLRIGPFDLCETVRQVLISFEKSVGDKRLSLDLMLEEEAILARGDADAIHRVVYNIVDNAIKFTPLGGELSIIVEERDRMACCTIRNSGAGIAAEDLPHLFDRFYKTDKSRSLDRRGSGLGLYIAKTIVDRHGGTIKADSIQGEYAAIIFTLPMHQQRNTVQNIIKGSREDEPEDLLLS